MEKDALGHGPFGSLQASPRNEQTMLAVFCEADFEPLRGVLGSLRVIHVQGYTEKKLIDFVDDWCAKRNVKETFSALIPPFLLQKLDDGRALNELLAPSVPALEPELKRHKPVREPLSDSELKALLLDSPWQNVPPVLLAGDDLELLDRQEAVDRALLYLLRRDQGREAKGILATFAPRGGGKTRFVDVVCRLTAQDLKLDEAREAFLPLPITFNDFSTLYEEERDEGPATALCRRVIFSYVRQPKHSWRSFTLSALGRATYTSLGDVLMVVMADFEQRTQRKPLVLVAVDELIRAESFWPRQILRQLGDVLNLLGPNVKVLVTTLDSTWVQTHLKGDGTTSPRMRTTSDRLIMYVSLPLLNCSHVVASLVRRHDLEQWVKHEDVLKALVDLTAGHPRSLSFLADRLKNARPESSFAYLANCLLLDTSSWVSSKESNPSTVRYLLASSVVSALVQSHDGEFVLDSPVWGVDGVHAFVPTLSLGGLLVWSMEQRADIEGQLVNQLVTLAVEDRGFELWLAAFVGLKWWAARHLNTQETTCESWFGGARVVRSVDGQCSQRFLFPAPSGFTAYNPAVPCSNKFLLVPESQNNPAYDFHMVLPRSDGQGSLHVFVEVKFSEIGAGTALGNPEINAKLDLMQNHDVLKANGLNPKDVIWVGAPLRKVVQKVNLSSAFTGSVILFDRECLLSWFGPTFRRLTSFWLSRLQQHEEHTVRE